jgi:hypothetical protein
MSINVFESMYENGCIWMKFIQKQWIEVYEISFFNN